MAKYCNKECKEIGAVCDFCIYYDYNGKDISINGKICKDALYVDKGYCNKLKAKKDPEEGCNDFICYRIKEKNV